MTRLHLLGRFLLLGTWGTCLALTLLPALPALYFQQGGQRSLVHTAAWLLAFPATSYWVARSASKWVRGLLRWVPRLQWALVGLLLLVPGYGWLVLFYFFLAPSAASDPAPSLLRRGQCIVRYQSGGQFTKVEGGGTPVLVQPVGPFLEWVTPLPPAPDLDSTWTLLDPQGLDLLDQSSTQLSRSRFHDRWLKQELATDFTPDTTRYYLPLPPATHEGRGVLGYVRGGRSYATQLQGTSLSGGLLRAQLRWRGAFQLTAAVGYDEELTLMLADFRGVGTYRLVRPLTTSDPQAIPAAQANYLALYRLGREGESHQYLSLPTLPPLLTITHFDSVRQVVAGTFSGLVHLESAHSETYPTDTLHLQQGRFDVRYR
jgi:hypothetical protein